MKTKCTFFRNLRRFLQFTISLIGCVGVINATSAAISHSVGQSPTDNYVYDQRPQETSEITFHPGDKAASGTLPDGTRFSVQDYQSSDGVEVSVRTDRCPSLAIAKKNLRKFIRNA